MTTDIARADAYDAAANYIEQNGWHQGDYYLGAENVGVMHDDIVAAGCTSSPAMCMAGAIAVYTTETEWDDIADHFRVLLGDYISTWNDDPTRTKEEVIDLLRIEALKLRVDASTSIKEEVHAA